MCRLIFFEILNEKILEGTNTKYSVRTTVDTIALLLVSNFQIIIYFLFTKIICTSNTYRIDTEWEGVPLGARPRFYLEYVIF